MGMYDTIEIPCPHCGATVEVQSKGGPCLLKTYPAHAVPLAVAGDARFPERCEGCGLTWDVVTVPSVVEVKLVYVQTKLEHEDNDE